MHAFSHHGSEMFLNRCKILITLIDPERVSVSD